MTAPFVQDADLTIYVGDALETLRTLPDGSVDCVVTSPPYWGLRDYGTGSWEGGDENCDHLGRSGGGPPGSEKQSSNLGANAVMRDVCGKCGARRVDRQLGLEPTPDEYVAAIVAVFREVRRVLSDTGTLWLNLGDTFNTSASGLSGAASSTLAGTPNILNPSSARRVNRLQGGALKPKDLVGVPWMVAFALRADGWWLRSDIIWAKPNPMPESVTDRPTKAHEYVFLLSKQPRYWFDQEAVRERYSDGEREWWNETATAPGNPDRKDGGGIQSRPAKGPDGRRKTGVLAGNGSIQHRDGDRWPNLTGRNVRSVWEIATEPYPDAHFATFPTELARRCLLAGTPEFVCSVCHTPKGYGRQQNITEQDPLQAPMQRVRESVRGSESEVLLPLMRDEGSGSLETQEAAAVRVVQEGIQPSRAGQVLLAEMLERVGDRHGSSPEVQMGEGQAPTELEGREDPRRRLHQGVRPRDEEVCAGTPDRDGTDVRSPSGADRVRASQEWDQARQPAGESGTDDAQSAQGHDRVPTLRRDVRDSVSTCCSAPWAPGVVLDPFGGSGTVGLVARRHNRRSILIELSPKYAELAAKRCQQLSLLAEGAA